MYIHGSALQPPLPPHGHGLVCTLYVGGFLSDIADMSLANSLSMSGLLYPRPSLWGGWGLGSVSLASKAVSRSYMGSM